MAEGQSSVEYRIVPEYPMFRVGSDGSIWTLWNQGARRIGDKWRQLKPDLNRQGYFRVKLRRGRKARRRLLHQVILETFVGCRPVGMQCRHLDGDSKNNCLGNLKWGTSKENCDDARRHGTMKAPPLHQGESQHHSILTVKNVLAIVDFLLRGG
jgi:HNH endonuclease